MPGEYVVGIVCESLGGELCSTYLHDVGENVGRAIAREGLAKHASNAESVGKPKADAKTPDTHANIGYAYFMTSDYEKAIEYL